MGEDPSIPAAADEVINDNLKMMDTEDNVDASEPLPSPRLMITKMILENFKSYAGVKEIGPFHKCFSSVVGPNGSGKSNVIDAMLFVFGKRAKKLRLNKVSELIHSSDAFKEKPLEYARVSVYFQEIVDTGDGDDEYEVIPDSEIVVSRIARRDNSSQYKLDGKSSTFKQVAVYLNSKGIDLDNNRFLILQGEVEMISMMPPKGKTENDDGLLEYLEDIIGSNKYVEQTNEAEVKVEALSEQRQERLNRVKAVEKEKESLQGAKLEAESLLGKEREIRRKKNILYQIYKMEVEGELMQIEEKNETLKKQVEEERFKLKETDNRVSEIENGLMAQTSEYDKAYDELVKTKERFAEFERKDIKLKEEIKHEKTNKKKLSTKIKSNTKKEEEALKKAELAEKNIPVLEKKIEKLSRIKEEEDLKLEKIFEQTKEETQSLRLQLEEKNQELSPVTQERAVYQAALDTAITEVKLLEDSTTRAKKQLDTAEKELSSLDDAQSNLRSNLAKLEDELSESRSRVEEAAKEDIELAGKEKILSSQHSQLVAKCEEAKALMQTSNSRSKAVSSILKAARKGSELSKVGIVGRLGDLATIDEKYDVAISTACGMLDHIVVQTTAGAQRCLDFLRKYNLGRANFIPLDKMKKGAHDRAVETPENAPRLFDLIRPGNYAVIPALYLGVGNTLVAPDLDVASRWAFDFGKRWRVVTVDGNLIESSGTMQGGGKSVRRGGMRTSNSKGSVSVATSIGNVSEDDCSEFETKAVNALEELKECRAKRKSLNEEVRKLKKRIQQLEVQLPKISMEIAGCDTTREELTKSIPDLKKQSSLSKSDAAKLVELTKKVKTCESDMAACAKLASKLEKEVSTLQKAILEAGGEELKIQQKRCDTVITKLNIRTKELSSSKVDITSSRKAAAKAKNVIENAELEAKEIMQRMESKMEELKSLEEKAMKVMEDFEEVKKIEEQKKKDLEAVSKEYEDLKMVQSKLKHSEVETVGKMDAYKKSIQDSKKRANHWIKEISKLNLAQEHDESYDYSDDEDDGDGDDDDDDDDDVSDKEMNDAEITNVEEEDAQFSIASKDKVVEKSVQDTQNVSKKRKRDDNSTSKHGLPVFPTGALEQYSRNELSHEIATLEKERDSIAKNANMGAIDEYRKKETDYLARVSELDEITETRNNARKEYEELRRLRLEMFMEGFGIITLKLKEMYQMITLGGDAELELVDSLDPFSEGIVFSVRPPKKSWKNIANLSGGEKTLSSLALVFALHHYKPTPLYVMDEIDAALDFKNVSIVANYIKERTKNAQFIIISLRNNMFELADRLVGIYKTHNCTKSITINPKAYAHVGTKKVAAPTPLRDRTNQSMTA